MKSYFKKNKGKSSSRRERKDRERISRNKLYNGEVTSELYTPLRFDKGGNTVRLLNQNDIVSSTETKMFGCEIVRDTVPNYVREMKEKLGLGEIIKVPIRTEGLTGSGKSFKCHHNSSALVERWGGQRLTGYSVFVYPEGNGDGLTPYGHTQLSFHSVWITPEGSAVCVSNNYDNDESITYDEGYILFIPFGVGCIEEIGYNAYTISFRGNWKSTGIFTKNMVGTKEVSCNINELENKFPLKQGLVVKENNSKDYSRNIWETLICKGHFYKKSLGSGKGWDELKRDVGMDRYSTDFVTVTD